ncbi:F-box/kelch-repeat protein At3g06240-like [Quercus lobata]|uniref:F-box/kelch-repeat protein At3g06240-like n=1 Tax=Quercus lobata TaxID=97700 RepID=UPI001244BA83|nr:F-box/kelch-repeat protein At3g06240-like [Quercus lobata]
MSNSSSKWRWGRRWRSCRLRLSSNNNLPSLPEELLEEILVRLPVKSLLRFRCVQKSWSTLVQNPTFIAKHLRHHQTKTKNPSILVEGLDKIEDLQYLLQSHPDEGGGVRVLDFKEDSMGRLLTVYTKILYFAFGFDQNSNDYKVVRVVEYKKESAGNSITRYCNSFYVYSLRAECWTQIFGTPIHHNNIKLHSCCNEIYFNGVHHWIGFLNSEPGDSYDHHIILSFDMSHEVFQIIRFPDMFFPNKTLAVFNDCLACIVYGINEYIDIWVMREYGVEDSWTKQLVVGHLLGIQRPLQLLGNEEILLVDENKTLVLYNIGSQEIKILQRTGYPKIFMPRRAIVYVESLVSFTGGIVFES